jgi:hypothetical protein
MNTKRLALDAFPFFVQGSHDVVGAWQGQHYIVVDKRDFRSAQVSNMSKKGPLTGGLRLAKGKMVICI